MRESLQMETPSAEATTTERPKLRIALLTNVIPPYHKPLLDRLATKYRNLRVFLSTPMESNRSWDLNWEGLDVVVQKTLTLNRHWRHPKGFKEPLYVHLPVDTLAQLTRFRPDVVISWEMGVRTMLSAVYRQTHPRTRLMVWAEMAESTEHGRGWARQAIRTTLHRSVDAFLVTGGSGARYLQSLGVPERKIFKISYTTDVHRFGVAPLPRSAERARTLLYVGQLIERKGLLPFLAVLAHWAKINRDQSVEFLLAGDGPLRNDLDRFQRPANLKLSFLGNLKYEALPSLYAGAGIFVLPSIADTWGVVVNEALASGLPVLGSVYAQAVSELVEDGMNGWTFRPDVGDEMYEALERSLTMPAGELDRMRERARKTAMRLTPEHVTDLVDRAIVWTAGQPSRSRISHSGKARG